jgi:hypothetical protein
MLPLEFNLSKYSMLKAMYRGCSTLLAANTTQDCHGVSQEPSPGFENSVEIRSGAGVWRGCPSDCMNYSRPQAVVFFKTGRQ